MSNYVCFDLEMNMPSKKIIEIGAVIVNSKGEIKEQFSKLIRIYEPLTEEITQLTGITDEMLMNEGETFIDAFESFIAFIKKNKAAKQTIVWGKGDVERLVKEAEQYGLETSRIGFRYFDVKTICQFIRLSQQLPLKAGLGKTLEDMGMLFEGKQHRALDDAYNTARIFSELIKRGNSINIFI